MRSEDPLPKLAVPSPMILSLSCLFPHLWSSPWAACLAVSSPMILSLSCQFPHQWSSPWAVCSLTYDPLPELPVPSPMILSLSCLFPHLWPSPWAVCSLTYDPLQELSVPSPMILSLSCLFPMVKKDGCSSPPLVTHSIWRLITSGPRLYSAHFRQNCVFWCSTEGSTVEYRNEIVQY